MTAGQLIALLLFVLLCIVVIELYRWERRMVAGMTDAERATYERDLDGDW